VGSDSATLRTLASSVSTATTCAPSSARRRAVAAPMPPAAPVTTATLPASPRMSASRTLAIDCRSIIQSPPPVSRWRCRWRVTGM
jgi:hypothetical protein